MNDATTTLTRAERVRIKPDACKQNKGKHEIDTIFVEGHTDNRPLNKLGEDNASLSFKRARAIHSNLLNDSMMAGYRNRVDQPLFSYSAYGDTRLIKGISGDDQKNRRVDLRIVLSYQPLAETLKNFSTVGSGK
jgi:chemotaxis protein MotB